MFPRCIQLGNPSIHAPQQKKLMELSNETLQNVALSVNMINFWKLREKSGRMARPQDYERKAGSELRMSKYT